MPLSSRGGARPHKVVTGDGRAPDFPGIQRVHPLSSQGSPKPGARKPSGAFSSGVQLAAQVGCHFPQFQWSTPPGWLPLKMAGASMQAALTGGQLSLSLSFAPSPPHQVPMLAGASQASPLLNAANISQPRILQTYTLYHIDHCRSLIIQDRSFNPWC